LIAEIQIDVHSRIISLLPRHWTFWYFRSLDQNRTQ